MGFWEKSKKVGNILADKIARFGGSWFFIIAAASFLSCWVLMNALSYFDVIAWDKYPFILLNLILSMLAAFQAPFILMSQKRSDTKQDKAYRSLFKELRTLIEKDLRVDRSSTNEIMDQLEEIKTMIQNVNESDDNVAVIEDDNVAEI